MFKLTRRVWLGTAVGGVVYGLPGCGKPAAAPGTGAETETLARGKGTPDVAPESVPDYSLLECPEHVAMAWAANASGFFVGQLTTAKRRGLACLWRAGLPQARELGGIETLWSCAHAINSRNHVAGEFEARNQNIHAFLWRDDSFIELKALGGPDSHAFSVNDRGLIAGYATDRNHRTHALLWHPEEPEPEVLKPLDDSPHAQALAVNMNGMIAGSSYAEKMGQAVVWKAPGEPLVLPGPSSVGEPGQRIPSIATAINEHGQVVGSFGGTATLYQHACRWTGGCAEDMRCDDLHDDRLGVTSFATSINKDGRVVGFYRSPKGEDRAFLHSGGAMMDLTGLIKEPRGLVARYARMIDDRGWIVGVGSRGYSPQPVAFVARPL